MLQQQLQPQQLSRQAHRVHRHPVVRCQAARAPARPSGRSSSRRRADGAAPFTLPELDPEAVAAAEAADATFQCNTVQWYPGHIAKAERHLKEQLKMVDLVLEVRDARIPLSTCHPQVPKWIGNKPRLVVVNRKDMISAADARAWDAAYTLQATAAEAAQAAAATRSAARSAARAAAKAAEAGLDEEEAALLQQQQEHQQQREEELAPPRMPHQVFWTDSKTGAGVHALRRAALKLSGHINAKRAKRGLTPRPVRACVIGFPNIGKSALINRLLGRRVVESAARPGVTRVLKWVRLGEELDLLDAPGIIPASFNDQAAAQALAMCNDIGEASYVDSLIAAAMLIRIKALPRAKPVLARLTQRYGAHPGGLSGEDFVCHVAGQVFGGDRDKAGVRLLNDYRNGALGAFALELPLGQQHHHHHQQHGARGGLVF